MPARLSKLILIVLYRTGISEAETVRSLRSSPGVIGPADKIFVWDNSPEPQPAQVLSGVRQALACEFEYRHTPENCSLAKIYNAAARENPGYDLLVLFDQDSSFGADYFVQLESAAAMHPDMDLFVPLVRHGSQIVSPGHFFYFKGKYWAQPQYGVVAARNNVAIASGMAIRMRYLRAFSGFDERLQLYGIDSNFMLRFAKDRPAFFVMDTPFRHELSDFNTGESRGRKRERFQDFKKASLINARLFPLPVRLLTRFFLFYKSIRF